MHYPIDEKTKKPYGMPLGKQTQEEYNAKKEIEEKEKEEKKEEVKKEKKK